jgi:hypothetical protein
VRRRRLIAIRFRLAESATHTRATGSKRVRLRHLLPRLQRLDPQRTFGCGEVFFYMPDGWGSSKPAEWDVSVGVMAAPNSLNVDLIDFALLYRGGMGGWRGQRAFSDASCSKSPGMGHRRVLDPHDLHRHAHLQRRTRRLLLGSEVARTPSEQR